jgi:hypothetical protein
MNEVIKAAYHEASHVIFAYFVGYTCDSIQLDEEGNGYAKLKYGIDTSVVEVFLKNPSDPSALLHWVNNLSTNTKAYASNVAEKVCLILISGAVAEFVLEHSPNVSGELNIEVSGPDLVSANILSQCFQFDLNKKILTILEFLKVPEFWNAVKLLANVITESGKGAITNEVIEVNLEHSGFLKLIKKYG